MDKVTAAMLSLLGLTTSLHALASGQEIASSYLGHNTTWINAKFYLRRVLYLHLNHRETEVLFLPDMTELSFTRLGGKYKEPTWIVMQYKGEQWVEKSIAEKSGRRIQREVQP